MAPAGFTGGLTARQKDLFLDALAQIMDAYGVVITAPDLRVLLRAADEPWFLRDRRLFRSEADEECYDERVYRKVTDVEYAVDRIRWANGLPARYLF
jgi:hypothetical protein